MSRGLLESLATRGRATTLLLAAALLGAAGGAWVAAGAPGTGGVTAVRTVADGTATEAPGTRRPTDAARPSHAGQPDKSPKPEKSAKPDKSAKPGDADGADRTAKADDGQGVHGRCVSPGARSDATGGANDNHGGAVSAAAKDCPRPTPTTTDD